MCKGNMKTKIIWKLKFTIYFTYFITIFSGNITFFSVKIQYLLNINLKLQLEIPAVISEIYNYFLLLKLLNPEILIYVTDLLKIFSYNLYYFSNKDGMILLLQ